MGDKWQVAVLLCAKCGTKFLVTSKVTVEYVHCPLCYHNQPTPYVDEHGRTHWEGPVDIDF